MQPTSATIQAIWHRLHAWLAANAPPGYGHLRPGADDAAIRHAERATGLKLPDDVVASYRIHDGQGGEPGLIGGEGWLLLPLRDALGTWGRWSSAAPEHTRRVPVGWNRAGDFAFVNLDPASGAPAGGIMVRRADGADSHPLAPSFSAWLSNFADELDDGLFAYSAQDAEVKLADDVD